jgi:septal ring factor EnvC (AmiA/AmiB activator)
MIRRWRGTSKNGHPGLINVDVIFRGALLIFLLIAAVLARASATAQVNTPSGATQGQIEQQRRQLGQLDRRVSDLELQRKQAALQLQQRDQEIARLQRQLQMLKATSTVGQER